MRNKRVNEIAMISVFGALIVVIANIPMIGFITIGFISLTTIHIPVLIGGTASSRRVSIALGLIFGLSSLFVALTRPVTPVDLLFQNPLVSVLPRILFGWLLYELYVLATKLIPNRFAAISISMMVSTFLHTLFVLLALYLVGGGEGYFGSAFLPFLWSVLAANGVWEIIAAGVIAAPIADRLLVYRKGLN